MCKKGGVLMVFFGEKNHQYTPFLTHSRFLAVACDNIDQATWNIDDLLDGCISNKEQDSLVTQSQLTRLALADIGSHFYALAYLAIDLHDQGEGLILR